MLEDRAVRNKIRHVVLKAEKDEIITKEEVAFIIAIIEKGRKEIEQKASKLNMLKGEIAQLKENNIIIAETRNDKELSGGDRIAALFSNRFTDELDKKKVQMDMLRGEIAQLRANEAAIVSLVENLIKAKERDIARQETAAKLREAREAQAEKTKKIKKALTKEQADKAEETKKDVTDKSGIYEPKD
jgi:hypothetical protein